MAVTLVIDSPAPGAVVARPFAVTGHAYQDGVPVPALVQLWNDVTGEYLGATIAGADGSFAIWVDGTVQVLRAATTTLQQGAIEHTARRAATVITEKIATGRRSSSTLLGQKGTAQRSGIASALARAAMLRSATSQTIKKLTALRSSATTPNAAATIATARRASTTTANTPGGGGTTFVDTFNTYPAASAYNASLYYAQDTAYGGSSSAVVSAGGHNYTSIQPSNHDNTPASSPTWWRDEGVNTSDALSANWTHLSAYHMRVSMYSASQDAGYHACSAICTGQTFSANQYAEAPENGNASSGILVRATNSSDGYWILVFDYFDSDLGSGWTHGQLYRGGAPLGDYFTIDPSNQVSPVWLRLEANGSTITAKYKLSAGASWTTGISVTDTTYTGGSPGMYTNGASFDWFKAGNL